MLPLTSSPKSSKLGKDASEKLPENLDIPNKRLQLFQTSLLEHIFESEEAFFSASLNRLQHGICQDAERLQSRASIHVTFVAVTFVFHSMNSSNHRFKRAQINVQAFASNKTETKSTIAKFGKALRIIKFAPHVVYGRVSTESLHWQFSLGATLGVTLPYTATTTPSAEIDHCKVLGSMLKIQGSTREALGVPSSKLVWSLEENAEQANGLPREQTFVFLIEQPIARAPFTLRLSIKPSFSKSIKEFFFQQEIVATSEILDTEVGQRFSCSPFNFATMTGQLEDLVELPGVASTIADIPPGLGPPGTANAA